ncbi:Superoxide dismutase [Cu-Zn] [Vanrija pseudolonga]|uniref:Superoxide dismutase [Cu-Zn] n=1 Tax=Vanrija pseudolonga TaxID=143232 RepID=A0AAF0YA43_9TREE|nr:Superoxide dismutase [Cu-Zn] [Vanrija pseudolonga]
MLFTKVVAAAAALAPLAVAENGYWANTIHAVSVLAGPGGVAGVIHFSQDKGSCEVSVTGTISGLSPNAEHGFHVHQFGDISGGCNSTGGHFNPFNKTHGAPDAKVRHVGDLGNIKTDANGTATVDIKDSKIQLLGARTIFGRGVVVHAGRDDLGLGNETDSKTTGHAGARAACGVIAVAN